MRYKVLSLATAVLLPFTAVHAEELHPIGVRALGMGGSNVASSRDTDANYWNPAAYGFFGESNEANDNNGMAAKHWGMGLDAGAAISIHQQLPALVDALSNIDFTALQTASQNGATFNNKQVYDSLAMIPRLQGLNTPGTGLMFGLNGSFGIRIGSLGIGVRMLGSLGATGSVDMNNLAVAPAGGANPTLVTALVGGGAAPAAQTYFSPTQVTSLTASLTPTVGAGNVTNVINAAGNALSANQAATGQQAVMASALTTLANTQNGGNLSANQTVLQLRGALITEVPFTYGYAVNENLSIGGSLKYMQAKVYASDISPFGQQSNALQSQIKKAYSTKSSFGLDISTLYRMPQFQAGLLIRNLNSPKFSTPVVGAFTPTTYTYQAKPEVRVGAAWIPLQSVTVEGGLDLTKNESIIQGYSSQFVSLGGEWSPWNVISLRGGFYKNIAQSDVGMVYTAGLGLNLWAVRLDVSAAMSSKNAVYKGKSFPREGRVALALSSDF